MFVNKGVVELQQKFVFLSSNIGSRGWLATTECLQALMRESHMKAGRIKLLSGPESRSSTKTSKCLQSFWHCPGEREK